MQCHWRIRALAADDDGEWREGGGEIVWLQGKMHPPQWKCKATSGLANGTIPEYPTPYLLNLVHKLY